MQKKRFEIPFQCVGEHFRLKELATSKTFQLEHLCFGA